MGPIHFYHQNQFYLKLLELRAGNVLWN